MRAFPFPAIFLAIFGLNAPAFAPALAQTTSDSTSQSTSQPAAQEGAEAADDAAQGEAEKKKAEEEKQKAELDALLLGGWVFLVPSTASNIPNDTALAAAARCLPKRGNNTTATNADAVGDIVFFRSTQGVQRFDAQSGKMQFYPELLRRDIGKSKTVWGLKNGNDIREIQFTRVKSRVGETTMLLDDRKIYMGCASLQSAVQKR